MVSFFQGAGLAAGAFSKRYSEAEQEKARLKYDEQKERRRREWESEDWLKKYELQEKRAADKEKRLKDAKTEEERKNIVGKFAAFGFSPGYLDKFSTPQLLAIEDAANEHKMNVKAFMDAAVDDRGVIDSLFTSPSDLGVPGLDGAYLKAQAALENANTPEQRDAAQKTLDKIARLRHETEERMIKRNTLSNPSDAFDGGFNSISNIVNNIQKTSNAYSVNIGTGQVEVAAPTMEAILYRVGTGTDYKEQIKNMNAQVASMRDVMDTNKRALSSITYEVGERSKRNLVSVQQRESLRGANAALRVQLLNSASNIEKFSTTILKNVATAKANLAVLEERKSTDGTNMGVENAEKVLGIATNALEGFKEELTDSYISRVGYLNQISPTLLYTNNNIQEAQKNKKTYTSIIGGKMYEYYIVKDPQDNNGLIFYGRDGQQLDEEIQAKIFAGER